MSEQSAGRNTLEKQDRGDPDPHITVGEKDEDLFLKKGGDLYGDVKGNEENEDSEYYEKMPKEDGGYYYMPMKEGVGHKQYGKANKQGYINIAGHNEPHDDKAIYANLGPEELSSGNDDQDGQELYEDMDHNRNPADDEQLYVKMDQDGNPRNLSPGDFDHAKQFYEDMNPEGNDVTEEVFSDMQPGATDDYTDLYMSMDQGLKQTPDSFGYVKPTSNRPFSQDAVLFNRSASPAAAIRAKQLENERKTQSLPAGRSQAEVMKSFIEQNVKSGKLTDEVAIQMMEQLVLSPPPEIIPRRGSTSSKDSTSFTSSSTCSSGSSGIGSLTSESEDAPPPVPQRDYPQKEKTVGRPRKPHSRSKAAPVEDKDVQGIFHEATALQHPPVKRRRSTPLTVAVSASPPKYSQPTPESAQPHNITQRFAARRPITLPRLPPRRPRASIFFSRPDPVVAPSKGPPTPIQQSDVPVLPILSGGLSKDIMDNSPRTDTTILTGIVTREGGVVRGEKVKLVCPPGAVDRPLHVTITLEEPSKYYGLIVQKDLGNDVMFGVPVIKLQPNGHVFKKRAVLTTKFKMKNFRLDDVLILNGTEARDGKITWEDITRTSTLSILDDTTVKVSIEVEHFSLIVALLKMTLIRTKNILSCLNLLGFNYTMSLLLYVKRPFFLDDELALVFVSQDVYNEEFYKEHETSSLVQLKTEGFRELHVHFTDGQEAKRIYNNERLRVSVHLGDDYSLGDSQNRRISLTVHSHVWWNIGEVIRIPIERTKDIGDARILCGTISVQGEYGHTSERRFCEIDLCGYVRSLLGVERDIFNLKPIAQKLKTPEELMNQITKSLKDEDGNLEMILQHWLKENDVIEDLAIFRKHLEDLHEKDYKVTQRGQMHVRHLREFATKLSRSLQCENTELTKYFCCKTQTLCRTVLRDCCIELEGSAEGVEAAASCTSHVGFLQIHRPIPRDIAGKFRLICSSSKEFSIHHFLAIAPYLIEITKDIFVFDGISDVQNGLKGLPEETLHNLCQMFEMMKKTRQSRSLCVRCAKFLSSCV